MVVQFGAFALDFARRRLSRGASIIHVTPKAFDLLHFLVDEAPRVIEKRELHERLWQGTFVSDATLVGLVKELRRALDDRDPNVPIIRTAHRVGYAFCPDVVRGAQTSPAPPSHWLVLHGRRAALQEGENVIGRNPASDVCLDAPGVSRSHARIVVDGHCVRLTDLGSKNGSDRQRSGDGGGDPAPRRQSNRVWVGEQRLSVVGRRHVHGDARRAQSKRSRRRGLGLLTRVRAGCRHSSNSLFFPRSFPRQGYGLSGTLPPLASTRSVAIHERKNGQHAEIRLPEEAFMRVRPLLFSMAAAAALTIGLTPTAVSAMHEYLVGLEPRDASR